MPLSHLCPTFVMSVLNLNIHTKVFRKLWTVSNSTPSAQFSGVVVVVVVVVMVVVLLVMVMVVVVMMS